MRVASEKFRGKIGQMADYPTVVNQIVVPDADGRFVYPVQAMTFFSEFLNFGISSPI